eukprot:scaffold3100_cov403-Prasinococcus_capsulatus_cf.AAC.12
MATRADHEEGAADCGSSSARSHTPRTRPPLALRCPLTGPPSSRAAARQLQLPTAQSSGRDRTNRAARACRPPFGAGTPPARFSFRPLRASPPLPSIAFQLEPPAPSPRAARPREREKAWRRRQRGERGQERARR